MSRSSTLTTPKKPRRRLLLFCVAGALALLAAACSSDTPESTTTDQPDPEPSATTAPEPDEPEPTAIPEPDPTAEPELEPTATPEPEPEPEPVTAEILESFVGATLAGAPVVDAEVMVYWNNGSNGTLIGIYHGPGLADVTGLCPGNSLNAGGAFSFVSNSPADAGACDGFPTPVSSVRVCSSNVWLYESLIPNDSEGTIFGSLERSVDGGIANMTSMAVNTPGTPEIDYSADVYTIPAMFTSDGSTEITCAAALT